MTQITQSSNGSTCRADASHVVRIRLRIGVRVAVGQVGVPRVRGIVRTFIYWAMI